ncbi:MAG: hypothetical protein PHH24_01370 [Candidatus Moranbacteria bacterium]|nr:hypothetical protein [Candidatus Moranbacteria bacterium]MDX9855505.1 hypothetical protein [Candidatus Moranbacteria bacterium]
MKNLINSLALLAILSLGAFSVAGAQEDSSADEVNGSNNPEDAIGLQWPGDEATNGVDCFDYYTFQSVNVSINPENEIYRPNESVKFVGHITNENDYPVIDGNVYVRISRYNENFDTEGHDVVDEFFAMEDISLNKNSSEDFDFTWDIPENISGGAYNADLFFSVGKKFNLGGLPFSNEVIAGTTAFNIESENSSQIYFNRDKTMIDGSKYIHIGSWPRVERNADVVFSQTLTNDFDEDIESNITFDTYYWDSLNEKDKINSETISVSIPANSDREIKYTISNAERSVYYLQTAAIYKDSKSIVNTRFSVNDSGTPRLNYPAITKFPLKKGDSFTLFSCFHNTGGPSAEGSVEVRLLDSKGNLIKSASYEGLIPPAMSAVKEDMTASGDYEDLVLEAFIKDKNGKTIDEYSVKYSCDKLGVCKENVAKSQIKNKLSSLDKLFYVFLAIAVVFILLIIIKIKRGGKFIGMLLFALILGSAIFSANQASAASVNSSKAYDHRFHFKSTPVYMNIDEGTVTLHNIVNGASSISCGGSTTYTYAPTLEFSTSGGDWDTPFGRFCADIYNPACFGSNIVTPNAGSSQIIYSSQNGHYGYIYWTAQIPTVSLSSSNTSLVTCSGMTCTARPGASGTASITASFGGSTAKIWSGIRLFYDSGTVPTELANGLWGMPARVLNRYFTSPSDRNVGTASGAISTNWESYLNGNGKNTLTLDAKSVSWNLTVGSCAVNGSCGTNDQTYATTTTSWPSTSSTAFCATGTAPSSNPSFPAMGSSVTWNCAGQNGGTSVSCTAERKLNGACGTRSDNYSATADPPYPYTTTAWPTGSSYCASGTASASPSFPAAGYNVSWTCNGAYGGTNASCSASRVAIPAPTLNLSATPLNIGAGASTTLAWTPTNVSSCTASGAWSGAKSTAANSTESVTLNNSGNYTFTLTCAGINGTNISRSITVTVSSCGSNARTYPYSTTTWPSTDISAFCSSASPAISSIPSFPAEGGTATWQCGYGNTGTDFNPVVDCSARREAYVPAPTVSLTANPESIEAGGNSNLTWTTANASSCWASEGTTGWEGWRSNTGGTWNTGTLNNIGEYRYMIECWNSNGDLATSQATLRVNPANPCGNGVLDPGETCDDGNTIDGDGCSSTCQTECILGQNYDCAYSPTGQACDASNCGTTITTSYANCYDRCDSTTTVSKSLCGSLCVDQTTTCPACHTSTTEVGEWTEVR